MVLVFPALLILFLVIIQFGLWYEAEHAAISAAQQGAQAARLRGGTAAAGKLAATGFLHEAAPTLVEQPSVVVTRSAATASASVAGVVESLFPGIHLHVSASASAPVEAFRR